jgi:16S rRNA processing protein RimM
VLAGRVGRPHGLDGSFHVAGADPELARDAYVVDGAQRKVTRRAGTPENPILRLDGSESRDDAEALRGAELLVPREDVGLEPGEYWASDLEGCEVVDGAVSIGFVRRMSALPSCEVLEVDRPDGSELLVPMVRDAIRSIDIEARRIDVDMEFLAG